MSAHEMSGRFPQRGPQYIWARGGICEAKVEAGASHRPGGADHHEEPESLLGIRINMTVRNVIRHKPSR
ncbi:hypothetical protein [Candidatus Methylacidiphilum infernorum]|uniref:hypothetical protein n=1 Tax=Candidatus Methylacidiphilum infernorum TaxID=511746 RepID=UPI0011D124AA|nr:hypothetical protein [Candidatus Methylacidiphilum infernorum]